MSEQPNRIATLLNPSSTTTTSTTDSATQGTVSYDVATGKHATHAQLGIDSSPDALITVDGHKVAAGDTGLSIDIAPDGSTHVVHGPQDPTQATVQPTTTQYGNGTQYSDGTQYANGTQYGNGTQYSDGTQYANGTQATDGTQYANGTQSSGDGSTLNGQLSQTGMTQDGTQSADGTVQPVTTGSDGSSLANGQYDPTGATQDPSQDHTQVEHLKGIGDHAAQVDLALHGPNATTQAPIIHERANGGQDITIPKGPDNPHAITVHVHPNKDGSFTLTVPKSHGNPHEIKIHVDPDKHVDLNITRDKDGHVKIDAHDHAKDQQDDWPGLQGPAGQNPGYGNGTDQPGQPGAPGQQPGTGGSDGGLPQTPGVPTPQTPQTPDVPTPQTPGGGGGGTPNTGGGSDGIPTPKQPQQPKQPETPKTPDSQKNLESTGFASISRDSVSQLGKDITNGPVPIMDQAQKDAAGANVGYPGFGIAGNALGLGSAHVEVRDAGATQFANGHRSLSNWVPNLNATVNNSQNAEDSSMDSVSKVPTK